VPYGIDGLVVNEKYTKISFIFNALHVQSDLLNTLNESALVAGILAFPYTIVSTVPPLISLVLPVCFAVLSTTSYCGFAMSCTSDSCDTSSSSQDS
jgi:hypothetical protein